MMTRDVQAAFDDLVDALEDWVEKHGHLLDRVPRYEELPEYAERIFEDVFGDRGQVAGVPFVTDEQRKELAERIATELFTNGLGRKAKALVLVDDGVEFGDWSWSWEGAAKYIEILLRKA